MGGTQQSPYRKGRQRHGRGTHARGGCRGGQNLRTLRSHDENRGDHRACRKRTRIDRIRMSEVLVRDQRPPLSRRRRRHAVTGAPATSGGFAHNRQWVISTGMGSQDWNIPGPNVLPSTDVGLGRSRCSRRRSDIGVAASKRANARPRRPIRSSGRHSWKSPTIGSVSPSKPNGLPAGFPPQRRANRPSNSSSFNKFNRKERTSSAAL